MLTFFIRRPRFAMVIALLLTWRLKKRPQVVSPEAASSS